MTKRNKQEKKEFISLWIHLIIAIGIIYLGSEQDRQMILASNRAEQNVIREWIEDLK